MTKYRITVISMRVYELCKTLKIVNKRKHLFHYYQSVRGSPDS